MIKPYQSINALSLYRIHIHAFYLCSPISGVLKERDEEANDRGRKRYMFIYIFHGYVFFSICISPWMQGGISYLLIWGETHFLKVSS